MQGKTEELTNVGLQSYVKELDIQDQMKLKTYVAFRFGKSYMTVNDKFAGRRPFSQTELLALEPIINQELWRQ